MQAISGRPWVSKSPVWPSNQYALSGLRSESHRWWIRVPNLRSGKWAPPLRERPTEVCHLAPEIHPPGDDSSEYDNLTGEQ